MAIEYSKTIISAILRVFRCRWKDHEMRETLLIMLFPFMSCESILDAAETCGVAKKLLYEAVNSFSHQALLLGIRRQGLDRLVQHLKMLEQADSSVQSRKCVTLCSDDFVRTVRGDMGGLAKPAYSGAAKKVVYGLQFEVLSAVIGENEDSFILDVRIVPPKHDGIQEQRATLIEWLTTALERLKKGIVQRGVTLKGCYLSVDSAYASGPFWKFAIDLELKIVSEMKSNLLAWSDFWTPVPAGTYFNLFEIGHLSKFKPISGDPEILHLRHFIHTKVYGKILVVLCIIGNEVKHLIASDSDMKSITIRRVAKRRWQLERVFWNLKQLVGLVNIHQQTASRVLVRTYFTCIVVQAAMDSSKTLKITVNFLHRILRRNPQVLMAQINALSASVRPYPQKPHLDDALKSSG